MSRAWRVRLAVVARCRLYLFGTESATRLCINAEQACIKFRGIGARCIITLRNVVERCRLTDEEPSSILTVLCSRESLGVDFKGQKATRVILRLFYTTCCCLGLCVFLLLSNDSVHLTYITRAVGEQLGFADVRQRNKTTRKSQTQEG